MRNYEELSPLGDGGFGVVTKMRNKATGQLVAAKRMKQRYNSFQECLDLKEVKSLRKIKHDNVVKLIEVFRESDQLYLVFELCEGNLLKLFSGRQSPLPDAVIRHIIYQLLSGIDAVHRYGFFHRDLKPENILFCGDVLKIVDFGLAREIRSRPPYTNYIGTRYYRAPEILLHHDFYNTPVDIWAVGAIAAELFLMRPLFPGSSETDEILKICSVLGPPSETVFPDGVKLAQKMGIRFPSSVGCGLAAAIPNAPPDALDFIKHLLHLDPHKRPSAKVALQHPFFSGEKMPLSLINSSNPERPISILHPSTEAHHDEFDVQLKSSDESLPRKEDSHPDIRVNNSAKSWNTQEPVNYNKFTTDLDDDLFNLV